MAFSFQDIKYGWVALASLGIITGTTIYVVNNQRQQVRPEDIIEIALGVHERCLATQYSTNPVSYYVTPPSFVRTWYSNVYTTDGVTVYTNTVTNTIGWHIDRSMMIELDVKIKALVSYYCDTNTVYDGSPDIRMLTATGLWASLQIGDKTNQFTREPCWTNPISTNWIVNYTSYWPSTNGVATNINYTSQYQQVVNYAESWTATGGHVWVSYSNWPSMVVQVTNAATYGDYPWQIYKEDLEERYKVLNALLYGFKGASYNSGFNQDAVSICYGNWEDAKNACDALPWSPSSNNVPLYCWSGSEMSVGGDVCAEKHLYASKAYVGSLNTDITHNAMCYFKADSNNIPQGHILQFDDFGLGYIQNAFVYIEESGESTESEYITSSWLGLEPNQANWIAMNWASEAPPTSGRGFGFDSVYWIVRWNFQYCTNKYW